VRFFEVFLPRKGDTLLLICLLPSIPIVKAFFEAKFSNSRRKLAQNFSFLGGKCGRNINSCFRNNRQKHRKNTFSKAYFQIFACLKIRYVPLGVPKIILHFYRIPPNANFWPIFNGRGFQIWGYCQSPTDRSSRGHMTYF